MGYQYLSTWLSSPCEAGDRFHCIGSTWFILSFTFHLDLPYFPEHLHFIPWAKSVPTKARHTGKSGVKSVNVALALVNIISFYMQYFANPGQFPHLYIEDNRFSNLHTLLESKSYNSMTNRMPIWNSTFWCCNHKGINKFKGLCHLF